MRTTSRQQPSSAKHLHYRRERNFKVFLSLVQPFISCIEDMPHCQLTEVSETAVVALRRSPLLDSCRDNDCILVDELTHPYWRSIEDKGKLEADKLICPVAR